MKTKAATFFLTFSTCWLGWFGIGCLVAGEVPRNIIVFIGDGMGMNHVQAASLQKAANEQREPVASRLAIEGLPVTGYLTTHSANMVVTDSAAAGTALACGVKTQNGVLGRTSDGKDVDSVAVLAKKKGKAVGILTSVALDDATPAAYYAHVGSRNERDKILEQAFAAKGVDVFMGGGLLAPGWTSEKLAAKCAASGMHYLTASELDRFTPAAAGNRRVFGYFDTNGNTWLNPMASRGANDPEPRLTTMTRKAMELLASRSARSGFFMMVEGGAIDKHSHGNDLTNAIGEVLELDQTVADTMAYLKDKAMLQSTLIVVTADHETGGLVLAENAAAKGGKVGKLSVSWTLGDHTCAWVPVFASGPGAARFAGRHDNTEVAKIITELLK